MQMIKILMSRFPYTATLLCAVSPLTKCGLDGCHRADDSGTGQIVAVNVYWILLCIVMQVTCSSRVLEAMC